MPFPFLSFISLCYSVSLDISRVNLRPLDLIPVVYTSLQGWYRRTNKRLFPNANPFLFSALHKCHLPPQINETDRQPPAHFEHVEGLLHPRRLKYLEKRKDDTKFEVI
ncbi:hypothetical protein M434DRAFT_341636 [Hypoxylon sp. CO27-5]|nr:hypothetical protein M434DRAFT_341636 [Hypoxylon sp. CO27-5]